ncbi:MAG: lytic transglycosylase domain-containing protein [Rhizobacter sp.]|nr:lytic transglycosylase domain-containing protein [Rhizobacter sp.]
MRATSRDPIEPVYESSSARARLRRALALALLALVVAVAALPRAALAQSFETTVLDARDALRKKDRVRLAALKAQAAAERNPLAMWLDYWELTNRINEVQPAEFAAFAERWKGTYVEDRLRNDWLLELIRRHDLPAFAAEYPRFRMNDDREVTCFALASDQLAGKDVRDAAIAAWLAQKDADDGCAFLAATLSDAKLLPPAEVWKKLRASVDAGRPRAMRQAASLLPEGGEAAVGEIVDSPARYLAKKARASSRTEAELTALAIARLAATDSESAASLLADRWEKALPPELASYAWASVARQTAIKLQSGAADQFLRAAKLLTKAQREIALSDDILAWQARAALRGDDGKPRWQQVMQAINAMSPGDQKDPTWVYWKARALQALARDSQEGESLLAGSRELLASIAPQLGYYGALAADELGQLQPLPPKPTPPTPAERAVAAADPGLARALLLIGMGLRNEGVREWNYAIRGLGDRELLAAAQLACDREVWDRCINTSEKTKAEIDIDQRYPTPLRNDVAARAREIGLDPAFVYGLIRQESRFIVDARSGVGASGLMQLMPATARWTARKIGLPYSPGQITDRDTNLRLGNAYLKLVLDDVGGSQPLAAAAYNAGPGRPRKWREGPVLDAAVWVENIPFPETRDYVKKVLANSCTYAAVLGSRGTMIRSRLGKTIGPPDPSAPPPDKDLP